jgi:hypothetical protein
MATAVVAGRAISGASSIIVPLVIGGVAALAGWFFEEQLRSFIGEYPWVLPVVIFFAATGAGIFLSRA